MQIVSVTVDYRQAMQVNPETFGLSWRPVGRRDAQVSGGLAVMDEWSASVGGAVRFAFEAAMVRLLKAEGTPPDDSDAEFLDRCSREQPNGCVVWIGPSSFRNALGALVTPTQLVWLKYRKNEPLPRRIGRTCGTRGCVNPAHLK